MWEVFQQAIFYHAADIQKMNQTYFAPSTWYIPQKVNQGGIQTLLCPRRVSLTYLEQHQCVGRKPREHEGSTSLAQSPQHRPIESCFGFQQAKQQPTPHRLNSVNKLAATFCQTPADMSAFEGGEKRQQAEQRGANWARSP